jgi:DNA-binding NarL/FixJ family response regulator
MKMSAGGLTTKLPVSPFSDKAAVRPGAVAIVDDEADVRVMLEDILSRSRKYFCAGSYASPHEALESIPAVRPEVVFMDIRMPGMSGIECARTLKAGLPRMKIIMLTGVIDSNSIAEASRAWSDGYLTKPFTAEQLLVSIRFALLSGSRPAPDTRPAAPGPEPAHERPDPRSLTARENDVMRLLAKGYLYKEIEAQLQLSGPVVKKVQHKIFLKLGVSNRTEAVSRWRTDH